MNLRPGEYMAFPIMRKNAPTIGLEAYKEVLFDAIFKSLHLSKDDLAKKGRTRLVSDTRSIFFFMMKEKYPPLSLETLGNILNRDHATVIYSIKKCKSLIQSDPFFKKSFFTVREAITARLEYGIK